MGNGEICEVPGPEGTMLWLVHGMLDPGDGDEPFPETRPMSAKSLAAVRGAPAAFSNPVPSHTRY